MTDKVIYVSTYAESSSLQVIDLPTFRFSKTPGSLHGAFKRYFDDLWHNGSTPGNFQKTHIDLETSAGGIVLARYGGRVFVALLRRDDGHWILPKGHRMVTDRDLEATAIREVCEETGLKPADLKIDRLLGHYSYDETAERLKVTKVVHLYLIRCRVGSSLPELRPEDYRDAEWWDLNRPIPEMLYTYQKSFLHEIKQAELPTS